MTPIEILILYLIFRAKQVICDFFLQTGWMAVDKGKPFEEGGAKALFSHVGIHAVSTLAIMLIYEPALWWVAGLDFLIHGTIDKVKGWYVIRRGWTYKESVYWWIFGIDQELHNLTHLLYIVMLVMHKGGVILP